MAETSKNPVTSVRLPQPTRNQIDVLTAKWNCSMANILTIAIDRMYQQEKKTMNTCINIDERYGEQVPATIADYQALNPDGKFVEVHGEIREILSDTAGDYEIVAIDQETIDIQQERFE